MVTYSLEDHLLKTMHASAPRFISLFDVEELELFSAYIQQLTR